MRVGVGVVLHQESSGVDLGALEVLEETELVDLIHRGHAIVANHRESECQYLFVDQYLNFEPKEEYLASIRGVCEALGVAHHARAKHHLATYRPYRAEREALEHSSVLQDESSGDVGLSIRPGVDVRFEPQSHQSTSETSRLRVQPVQPTEGEHGRWRAGAGVSPRDASLRCLWPMLVDHWWLAQ